MTDEQVWAMYAAAAISHEPHFAAAQADTMLAEHRQRFPLPAEPAGKYPPTPYGFGPAIDGPPPIDAEIGTFAIFLKQEGFWLKQQYMPASYWNRVDAHCMKEEKR